MKFSANLGFLWADRPLPDAIRAAKAAGFDAVECHWPYDVPAIETKAALEETGLSMLGLNTRRGNVAIGENGLAALPGREADARSAIDEAIAYAAGISAAAIHVMAGNSSGPRARQAFCDNLAYACEAAGDAVTILIEPLNHYNAPGYFLNSTSTGGGYHPGSRQVQPADDVRLLPCSDHGRRCHAEVRIPSPVDRPCPSRICSRQGKA